jgi:hypothetical protein
MWKSKLAAAMGALFTVCGLATAPAHAGVYWNNGPVSGDTGYCDNSPSPTTPTGCVAGFTIYDDFTSRPDLAINTITYDTYLEGSAPLVADVTFYDHNPETDSTNPLYHLEYPVTTSPDAYGATLVTMTNVSIVLPAGHYWIGMQNFFTDDSVSSFGETSQHHLQSAEQGEDGGSVVTIAPTVDAAFTLQSDVPEPASWALMLVGFGLAGAGLRRKKSGAATLGRNANRAAIP